MKWDSHLEIKLAKLVSLVTQPTLVLIVGSFIVVSGSDLSNFLAACVFLIVGGLMPVATDIYDYFKSKNAKLEPDFKHRNEVYLTALFSFSIASLIFGSSILTSIFWMNLSMIMGIFFALFYLANRYFVKASLHAGMFCFVAMLLVQRAGIVYALAFTALPIIIWARIRLGKHTWAQVLVGTAIGMSVGLLTWLIK
jgi:membrane-associated phospholipid phosphatase